MYTIETDNFIYEVSNWKRKDETYNVYVKKTSKLSNTYIGEACYAICVANPLMDLHVPDVTVLSYSIR